MIGKKVAMIFEEFEPKSEVIKKHIISYYIIKSDDNKKKEFIYYPHFIDTLNIFSNSSLDINDQIFKVRPQNKIHSVILSAGRTKFRKAVIYNNYDIVGMHFKTLSIHHFFDVDKFTPHNNDVFEINEETELKNIYQINHFNDRIDALEQHLLSLYKEKPLDEMVQIVKIVHESLGNIKMNDLEQKTNLSRRTILRKFRKYLFCSFEEYKNIVRFRMAIDNFKKGEKKASNLIGDISYYDQSNFIHQFKSITGESPNKLLNQIRNNPESFHYFWKFLDQ